MDMLLVQPQLHGITTQIFELLSTVVMVNHNVLGISKALTKLSKEKGSKVIAKWIKACVRHFHWSVRSTTKGQGKVILAKFE